ncbi:MAG: sulfatase family protein [Planctomycetota bacterium]
MRVAAALVLAGLLLASCGPAGKERPHVVVLLWDTTRADRLGCYGDATARTPWLDSLAERGTLYEQCRPASTWTLPSHASLFTGLLPSKHGATAIESPLAPANVTLAEELKEAGYETMLISCNGLVGKRTGLAQGFDHVHELFADRERPTAERVLETLRRELSIRRNDAERSKRPLFLFVNLMEPHLPYDSGPADAKSPVEGLDDRKYRQLRRFQFPRDMAHNLAVAPLSPREVEALGHLYAEGIAAVDDASRRIEALLVKEGILRAEGAADGPAGLIAVTSDHGENLGEHGLLDHKLSVHETLLRIPLVVAGHGDATAGRRFKPPARLLDLHALILQTAGVREDPKALVETTEPLLTIVQSAAPTGFVDTMRRTFPKAPTATFDVFQVGMEAVISGDGQWKWVRHTRADDGTTEEFLYDLVEDPGETNNVAADHPDRVKHLRAAADAAR